MTLVFVLVCCLPVVLVFMVILAIGAAAMKLVRHGKRTYEDIRPQLEDLKKKAERAQHVVTGFAERGNKLSATFEEISGRWAFVDQTFKEAKSSPIARFAGIAGRFAGRKTRG